MEEYEAFWAEVRKALGIEAFAPDETGLVSVSVDGRFNMNLQYVEASRKVLCFVEVAHLDDSTPTEVYRELLAAGLFGRDTGGGYFALEPESNIVVYNYLFDFDVAAKDTTAFVATLEKILALCEMWEDRITHDIADAAPAPVESQLSHVMAV